MAQFDYDLFTLGAGSGGVRACRFSARYGARVAVAESGRFGGTCVNVGCIPKKLFAYAAHYRGDLADAADFGWSVGPARFDWTRLLANKDREIARLNGVYENLLRSAGVEMLRGRAVVLDPHTVEVDGRRVSARYLLVATGARAFLPGLPGIEHAVTSDAMFSLPRLPRRALVVGGGYIALEFASILNGLGVETTLAYRGARLLRKFDTDIGERLAEELARKGISVRLHAAPHALERRADGAVETAFEDGARVETDLVLFATSRVPNTAGLGLEAAGVRLADDGAVQVDAYLKSSVESIYALGDVANRHNLTPVATAEGMALARTLFGGEPTPMDYDHIPTAVFSDPNAASVGLSEQDARARGPVDVYKTSFRSLKHTLGASTERVFMKLVVDAPSRRVLGAHMVGPDAGEIIQGIAIAVKLGATKPQFDATIGIHPTLAEEFVTLREKAA